MASFQDLKPRPKIIYAIFLFERGNYFFDLAFDNLTDALRYKDEVEAEAKKAKNKTLVSIHRCEESFD